MLEPVELTKAQVEAVLEEWLDLFRQGDSLEGNMEILVGDTPAHWSVRGTYRTGNLQGQGGMVVVGEVTE